MGRCLLNEDHELSRERTGNSLPGEAQLVMKGSCQTTLTESSLHLKKGEWGAEGMGDKVLREEGDSESWT